MADATLSSEDEEIENPVDAAVSRRASLRVWNQCHVAKLDCERMGKSNTTLLEIIKNSAWCAEESVVEEVWKSSMQHVFILGVCSFRIAPGVGRGGGIAVPYMS